MIIRVYKPEDKEKCLAIFQSNCPKYFDKSEFLLFEKWLDHQANEETVYKSATYSNAIHDAYYVITLPEFGLVGCGGFYIVKEPAEARLAWGMIHADYHRKGYGTALFHHRQKVIAEEWPGYRLSLGTSQHTYPFYEKMGLHVTNTIPSGYGEQLDRYDMII